MLLGIKIIQRLLKIKGLESITTKQHHEPTVLSKDIVIECRVYIRCDESLRTTDLPYVVEC